MRYRRESSDWGSLNREYRVRGFGNIGGPLGLIEGYIRHARPPPVIALDHEVNVNPAAGDATTPGHSGNSMAYVIWGVLLQNGGALITLHPKHSKPPTPEPYHQPRDPKLLHTSTPDATP